MFRVIEITRGIEPESGALLFGHTVDRDFYIIYKKIKDERYRSTDQFISEVNNAFKRTGFVKSKDLPLYDAFNYRIYKQ